MCKTAEGETCFQNIQQIRNKLYLSSVSNPIETIEDVSSDQVHIVQNADGSLSEPIKPEGGKVAYVSLNVVQDETKLSKFSRHDNFIAKLYNELSKEYNNILVIYTGKHFNGLVRGGRYARQAEPQETAAKNVTTTATQVKADTSVTGRQVSVNGTFFKHERFLIYFKLLAFDSANITVDSLKVEELGPGKLRVELIGENPTDVLAFNVSGESGYWQLSDYTWRGAVLLSYTNVATLDGFSFSCQPAIRFLDGKGVLSPLQWFGLQVEPYFGPLNAETTFNRFNDAWDCVGFTSPGIWAGLFVTLLMLVILTIGLSWMMEIRTMDRFDDPKGKTITTIVSD